MVIIHFSANTPINIASLSTWLANISPWCVWRTFKITTQTAKFVRFEVDVRSCAQQQILNQQKSNANTQQCPDRSHPTQILGKKCHVTSDGKCQSYPGLRRWCKWVFTAAITYLTQCHASSTRKNRHANARDDERFSCLANMLPEIRWCWWIRHERRFDLCA